MRSFISLIAALLLPACVGAQTPDSVVVDSTAIWQKNTKTYYTKHDTTVVRDSTPGPTSTAGHQVSPSGGTGAEPWSLAYALTGAGGKIVPGDTVLLRAGTYPGATITATVAGTAANPVVIKPYPSEHPILKGILQVKGAYVRYQGFEYANTSTALNAGSCIDVHAAGVKLIGLTIHDCGGNAIGAWGDGANVEVVGCVLYNNGWNSPAGGGGYGHGIYVQSVSPNTAVLRDNAIYDSYAFGIHGYTEGGSLSGIQMIGNAVWNSGVPGPREPLPNLFIGSSSQQANRIVVRGNMVFVSTAFVGSGNRTVEFGYGSQNADIVVESNVIANGNVPLHLRNWTSATVRYNLIQSSTGILSVDGSHGGWTWVGNGWGHTPTDAAWRMDATGRPFATWKTAAGATSDTARTSFTGQTVMVRPNPYEKGRGLIAVMNWSGAASVSVDLTSIAQGQSVKVRHAHAPFGAVLATGTGMVSLPTANVVPPTPLPGWAKPVPVIGPAFAVYIVSRN